MASPQFNSSLDKATRPGDLVFETDSGRLLCVACGHRCQLASGQRGICKVRYNQDGILKVPFNYAAGVHNDPIEKKPFFHALPGSQALSFGMLGCDFKCAYCQNWFTSQSLRDDSATENFTSISAEELCERAIRAGSDSIVSTYNEPLITSEWAVEVFKEARSKGLLTGYVSNGHGTPEVIDYIRPWVDLYKVDLKCFDEKKYRRLGGNLNEVLQTLERVHSAGLWLEVVTLVIPDYNDSDKELSEMANFLASVSSDIPWHLTAFHPDYQMTDRGRTPLETLERGYGIAKQAGLNFVYCGNTQGKRQDLGNTVCPICNTVLIARKGFRVLSRADRDGVCPQCNFQVPGRWHRVSSTCMEE